MKRFLFVIIPLFGQALSAMQQEKINGPRIFYRYFSVENYAQYTITPPEQGKLILSENWLALDKESQCDYYTKCTVGGTIGNVRYAPDYWAYHQEKKNCIQVPKICTFIAGEPDAQDFDINDYLLLKDDTKKILFDGVQPVDETIYSLVGEQGHKFFSHFHVSLRKRDGGLSDGSSLSFQSPLQINTMALKYPYTAYSGSCHDHYFLTTHEPDFELCRNIKYPLKKLSWLQGRNLLALSQTGDIITIAVLADDHRIYRQHFGEKKFIDIAVDMKHPWRFIALTDDFNIIYADFSSHTATFETAALFNFGARAINYCAGKKIIAEKVITQKFSSKKTYRTILQLPKPAEEKVYKIWFHNNKIGLYCGAKDTVDGTLDIYKLEDRIFMLSMHDVEQSKNKETCISDTVKLLDCHPN